MSSPVKACFSTTVHDHRVNCNDFMEEFSPCSGGTDSDLLVSPYAGT